MSQDHLAEQRQFHREKEETVDKRRGWKTILRSGQGWTLLALLGQLKTRLSGKGFL